MTKKVYESTFYHMKKRIAVVMGGYSSEAAISFKSGAVVCKHLNPELFDVYPVHILPDTWYVLKDDVQYPIQKSDFSIQEQGTHVQFDVVFNAIHGAPGENGSLMAYFELLGVPHTSAPFYQMALTFNKRDCLSVVKAYGIQTAVSYYFNDGDSYDVDAILAKVGLPCFVKPNGAGSSYGISKVYTKEEFIPAVEKAAKEDREILVESFLDGTEVSVGVIQYQGAITVLPITEIVSENDFFDYEAKYLGKSQEITPARLAAEEQRNVEAVAKRVYEILNMKGFSRSEYILVDGVPHFIEMNTVPGMTEESILPQQANAAGISLAQLFENAITMALTN